MGELLKRRRKETGRRIQKLRSKLEDAEARCEDKACVYITGSYGRGESSRHSDLDVFIVGHGTVKEPALRGLDEILIKADLIDVTRQLRIPDFSGDGEYLKHYPIRKLVGHLGKPRDDVENTFTARLLLLLESSPLIGAPVYHQIIEEVIKAYWKDYEQNKNSYMPAFLANDILRMWRTFCVNYEARTHSEPAEEMAKKRLKNYKLQHSRLLTCYSALLYLLAVFDRNKTVGPTDAKHMISLTPTERLEWILKQPDCRKAHGAVRKLIKQYEAFLLKTDAPENHLVELFQGKAKRSVYFGPKYEFGNSVAEVLTIVGNGSLFYRLLVV